MDEAIRDLERRVAEDPQAWPLLARARLRAGARSATVLDAVRAGLRAFPASLECARVRDEALEAFWRDPHWRVLFEREGTGGERVRFSADGALIAAAGRGVVVVDVEANRVVGAGFAGRAIRALAFLGRELLLDDEGLAHWDPVAGRERARVPGTASSILVAVSADSTRGFAVTANGRAIRLAFDKGKVVANEPLLTLVPPPVAALAWPGISSADQKLALDLGNRLVIRSGASFEDELQLQPSGARLLSGLDAFEYALVRLGAATHNVISEHQCALSPDARVVLWGSRDLVVFERAEERTAPVRLELLRPRFRAAAFSPCGSRLAVVYDDRLVVLEAC